MQVRCLLLICAILMFFTEKGMAQTDSVYSKMILGSAGYITEFSFSAKHARPQAALIICRAAKVKC